MDQNDQMGMRVQQRWEGRAYAKVKAASAEQVWPLLEDFFALNKWFPTLEICLPVEGISGQPGCVRYCAGFKTPVDKEDKASVNWTKQKLLTIDRNEMVLSYSIIDSNVGFNGYVATWKMVQEEDGCGIEWKYEVEPVNGWKLENLDFFAGTGLQVMAKRMEEALQA